MNIPQLALRPFRDETDFPGMAAALNASEAADGVQRIVSPETIANHYRHLTHCDLSLDLLLAVIDEETVGYCRVEWQQNEDGSFVYSHFAFLKPEWRRKRIGTALLAWAQERLRTIAAAHPADAPRSLTTFVSDSAPGTETLLKKDGYRPLYHSFGMERPSLENIPEFPLPAGLEVRPVQPQHYRTIWQADQEAFRDHRNFSPGSEEDYQGWLTDTTTFMPELWQIAWDVETDQIAGQVRSFINHARNEKFQRKLGWTEFISTRRPWRGRGLARALIALSLQVLKHHGMTEAALNVDVDTDHLSDALRIYEACGFRPVKRNTWYAKALVAIAAPAQS